MTKIHCKKENLERAVITAERFTGKNAALPVLGNLLFEFRENELFIAATNLEHAIEVSVPGESAQFQQKRLTVPAKLLSSLVQSLSEETVQLMEERGNLLVRTDTKNIRIQGMSPDDFPLIPKIKKSHSFGIDALLLRVALAQVLPAVSLSELKPELAGVLWKISSQELKLAATDTFRLAEKTVALTPSKTKTDPLSFILPFRVAQEMERVFLQDGIVDVIFGENQIVVEWEGMKITSRCVDGNFPEYGGIVPTKFEAVAYVSRSALVNAIRASSLFSSKLQDVTLAFQGSLCEISSANQEIGEYRTTISVEKTGKDLTASFSYRFLLDGLNAIEGDEVWWGINSENTPSLLRDKSDNTFLYIAMPIRLT